MEKSGKKSSGGEIDFFKVPYHAMDANSSSDYSFWLYGSGSGRQPRWKYRQVSKNKVQIFGSHDLTMLPKQYKGKRLTKHEIQFLLSVRKRWGAGLVSSPEHIDSLLAMHRFAIRSSRKGMMPKVLFGGAAIAGSAFLAASVLSGVVFSAGLVKVFGVSLAFALPAITATELIQFVPERNRISNIDIEEVFMIADSKYIHDDFAKYCNYLHGEWSSLSDEMKSKISAQHPIPSMLDTYRERYRAMLRLDITGNNLEKRIMLGSGGQTTSFLTEERKAILSETRAIANERKAMLHEARERKTMLHESRARLGRGDRVKNIAPEASSVAHHEVDSWDALLLVLESVKKEWAEWEMDILRIVQYPALFDMREKATIKFHRALIFAESKKPSPNQPYSESHPFSNAVADLQLAWTVAKNEAERIQQSHFKKEERVRLSRALDLLSLALNSAGTPHERQASYKRAMKQLEGLVRVPAAAMAEIESGVGLKELQA